MQYKFELDGQVVENPSGWDKMIRRIVRDKDLKTVLLNLDAKLTFRGNAHFYLYGLHKSGYCGTVKIDIFQSRDEGQSFYQRYTGTLFVNEMDFDEFKCYSEVKVTDNSYYAHVSTNRNVKTSLLGGRSKNSPVDFNIAPVRIQTIQLFDPSTCTYFTNVTDYGGFNIDHALKYLVQFMSDDKLDYYSPIFGPGGKWQFLTLTFGYALRRNGVTHDGGTPITEADFTAHVPKLSFEMLFSELNRFLNLGIYFDVNPLNGKPRMVIDEWSSLFRNNSVTTFRNLPNLKVSTSSQDIYSAIRFGGAHEEGGAFDFPGDISFVGFKEEEFFTVTKCNVDNILDLSGDFIVDTNIIQLISLTSIDVAGGDFGDDSYDNDWFLLDATYKLGDDVMQANQSNWLDASPPCFYNEFFTNKETAKRYFGFLPAPIADYLSALPNSEFKATKTSTQSVPVDPTSPSWEQILFQNDSTAGNYDPNGVWNTATSQFTVGASGVYSFQTYLIWEAFNQDTLEVALSRYDSTFTTLLDREIIGTFTATSAGTIPLTFSGSINAVSTDIIVLETRLTNPFAQAFFTYNIYTNSYITCTASVTGGGTYQDFDPAKYPVVKNTFTMEVEKSQTDAIEASPLSQINFYIEPLNVKTGFVEDISINEFEGTIQAVLIQGTGYPPVPAPCADEFGPFIIQNADFSQGDTIWNKLQNPVNWNITTSGAEHLPPGSAFPLDGIEQTSLITNTSPTGKWRVKVAVTNMTTGTFFVDAAGYSSAVWNDNGTFLDVLDLQGDPLTSFTVVVSADFDGLIVLADIQPQTVECDDCVIGFGPNVLPNYGFHLGDNGDWDKNPNGNWLIDTSGALHFDNGGAMTADNISTNVIVNQTSPTGKWKVTVRVTGRTAGDYQVNAAGYVGTPQVANGTYSEILDLTGDPLTDFKVIVSDDFDGKIHIVKAEAQLNEC